jgi:hypothetical protein
VQAALVLGLLLLLIDRFTPPQHLAWKPLRLEDPIGAATRLKIAALGGDPERCVALLRRSGVRVTPVPDRDDGGYCVVRGGVRLEGGVAPLTPRGLVMRCPLAVGYVIWERQVVQPAARSAFGARVTGMDSLGTYACRTVRGSATQPSQHARANAVDVAGFRLANGRRVTVLDDWEAPDGYVKRVRKGACRVFGATLGPDYDRAHANHLHLDQGGWPVCR